MNKYILHITGTGVNPLLQEIRAENVQDAYTQAAQTVLAFSGNRNFHLFHLWEGEISISGVGMPAIPLVGELRPTTLVDFHVSENVKKTIVLEET
jgi:hypothetical protein